MRKRVGKGGGKKTTSKKSVKTLKLHIVVLAKEMLIFSSQVFDLHVYNLT